MYEMNHRRYDLVPRRLVDETRRIGYGLIGLGVAIRWKPQPIMVLSHMRAGSSLLTRVLTAHPDVTGYGELHLAYKRPLDFAAARGKIAWVQKSARPTEQFWLDKVLHSWLLENEDWKLLLDRKPKVVFLLREPRPTVQSLVGSFGMSETESIDYYIARAEQLASFGMALTDQLESVMIRYADLTERTDLTLETLRDYLGLRTPLSANYGATSWARGADPSANLSTGVILRSDQKPIRHDDGVVINDSDRLNAAFEHAREVLSATCRTV